MWKYMTEKKIWFCHAISKFTLRLLIPMNGLPKVLSFTLGEPCLTPNSHQYT